MRDWPFTARWGRFPRRGGSSVVREPRIRFRRPRSGSWNLRGRIKEASAGFRGDRLRTIGKALIALVIVADAAVLALVLTRNETSAIDRDRRVQFESTEDAAGVEMPSTDAGGGTEVAGAEVDNKPQGDGKAGGNGNDRQGNDRRDGQNDGGGNASGGDPTSTGSDSGGTDGGSSTGGSTGDSGGSTGDGGGSGGDSGGSGGDGGSGGTEEPTPAPEPGPGGGGPGGGGGDDGGGDGGGGDGGGGGGGGA
jgi:hypothetical protein